MRELKFRAWNKKGKRWLGVNLQMSIVDGLLWWQYGNECEILSAEERKNIELMQYMGLKDKNEVEIYEGDILEYDVLYNQKRTFIIKSIEDLYFNEMLDYVFGNGIIIGNVYDNPELMEEDK